MTFCDTPPSSWKDSNANPKMKTMKEKGIGACSLVYNIFGWEECVVASRWGLGKMISGSIIHIDLHKPNNKLVSVQLKHFWCMNKPWAYTRFTRFIMVWTLMKSPPSPLVISMVYHRGYTQMSFFLGLPNQESQNSGNWVSYHFGRL